MLRSSNKVASTRGMQRACFASRTTISHGSKQLQVPSGGRLYSSTTSTGSARWPVVAAITAVGVGGGLYLLQGHVFAAESQPKPKLVILGSGWGALSVVRELDTSKYDVTIVSPRNYFLFTPLLPSVTVGTLEPKAIIEPIRKYCRRSHADVDYFEAVATDVDPTNKTVSCHVSTPGLDDSARDFTLPYDKLVVAVGAINNTFGGPTGVEAAAELRDFVQSNVHKWFPKLEPHVSITLVELMDHILSTYDAKISTYTTSHFKNTNIDIRTKSRVVAVKPGDVIIQRTDTKETQHIPYGLCIWSTGIGTSPLINKIREKLPQDIQTNRRALLTDQFLRVKGADGIYALGDCATIAQEAMLGKLNDLFKEADLNKDNHLQIEEFRSLIDNQEGQYLGKLLNRVANKSVELDTGFHYKHLGSFCFIGSEHAVAEFAEGLVLEGFGAWWLWRSVYLSKQYSLRNKLYVGVNWLKTWIFGRDITRA
ncbi:NADH dehydrogenase, extrinsic, putative [Acanthamoeba castellanii str. Neff]|uniref:NADH:ubiquinone reductase (non-electrogenic) n=1 Tax=Acanthamoeba castellanii (strain ATCC 30010 / Neff) TaxID=1257118 RepID=L8H9D8_ACACF|nr:NADH dehydrogenase, extrinsic, putative [Acanthamoeba castellanii str. Neff]ELR21867.1 NADH dehydrogenase, extrinsic, putative [Acanthamoeba castellanii str. Neff]